MKQVKQCLQWCSILVVTMLFSGCGILSPVNDSTPAKYVFYSMNVHQEKSKPTSRVLLVSEPESAAGYDTAKMIYVKEPYHLQSFVKNEWADLPSLLLQPLIVEKLQKTEHFKAVVTPPFSGISNLRLDTQVVRLQQSFIQSPSQVEFVVNAQLINVDTRHVIATHRFAYIVPAAQETPYAGVYAANQAVNDFLNQLTQFVVSYT